jgi:acyl-CoA reductase-like NAD-dependent aldehyde dehydrogenase
MDMPAAPPLGVPAWPSAPPVGEDPASGRIPAGIPGATPAECSAALEAAAQAFAAWARIPAPERARVLREEVFGPISALPPSPGRSPRPRLAAWDLSAAYVMRPAPGRG